jgi:hypothetical protein
MDMTRLFDDLLYATLKTDELVTAVTALAWRFQSQRRDSDSSTSSPT